MSFGDQFILGTALVDHDVSNDAHTDLSIRTESFESHSNFSRFLSALLVDLMDLCSNV